MNRHQRRADLAAFRHEAHRNRIVTTHLIDGADLGAHPPLERLAAAWREAIPTRRPWCIACKTSFAKTARPGGYLFARPPEGASFTSVSVLCIECWDHLPETEVERIAARVLSEILPGGRFLDAP